MSFPTSSSSEGYIHQKPHSFVTTSSPSRVWSKHLKLLSAHWKKVYTYTILSIRQTCMSPTQPIHHKTEEDI